MVHGYARKEDCARLVNMFHAQCVALGCLGHGEWVPTKANVGDLPSRPERFHEIPGDVVWVRFVLPDIDMIEAGVGEWIDRVRSGQTTSLRDFDENDRGASGRVLSMNDCYGCLGCD